MKLFSQLSTDISIHVLREEDDSLATPPCSCCLNFNPRPPRGGRPEVALRIATPITFQSTSSARRTTRWQIRYADYPADFNPRPPRGGRPFSLEISSGVIVDFNPRPPRGGRQILSPFNGLTAEISIHVLREEDDFCRTTRRKSGSAISIHVLREEDDGYQGNVCSARYISIHVLREEDDGQPLLPCPQ